MDMQHNILPNGGDGQENKYRYCLIKPMGANGDDGLVDGQRVIDAFLVGLIVFSATFVMDVWPTLFTVQPLYLSASDFLTRLPTALMGALFAFAFQWARARGIKLLEQFPFP